MQLYRNRRVHVNMRTLQVKRSSFLIEPANRPTQTLVGARASRPFTKTSVLETFGEILSLLTILIVGWILYVVF